MIQRWLLLQNDWSCVFLLFLFCHKHLIIDFTKFHFDALYSNVMLTCLMKLRYLCIVLTKDAFGKQQKLHIRFWIHYFLTKMNGFVSKYEAFTVYRIHPTCMYIHKTHTALLMFSFITILQSALLYPILTKSIQLNLT